MLKKQAELPSIICCICQPNELQREFKHKVGGPNWGPSKNLGGHGPPMAHPGHPLESPLHLFTPSRPWTTSGPLSRGSSQQEILTQSSLGHSEHKAEAT